MSNRRSQPIPQFWRYLALDAAFEGGRMLVGAISVPYLLSSGLSLSQVATLKTLQALVVLLGELPTGIFADTFGRARSLLAALGCGMIGLLLYGIGVRSLHFYAAEICTALALCFWSGAYEAYAIDRLGLDTHEDGLDRFFHQGSAIGGIVVMIGGFVGGLIGGYGFRRVYFLAAAVFAVIFVCLAWRFPMDRGRAPERRGVPSPRQAVAQMWEQGREMCGLFRADRLLLVLAAIPVLVQFLIQPLLHYWQPMLQERLGTLQSAHYGTIFLAYSATIGLASYGYAKVVRHPVFRSYAATGLLFTLFVLHYLWLAYVAPRYWAVLAFCMTYAILSVARTSTMARLNDRIAPAHRAAALSGVSFASRLGMLGALGIIQLLTTTRPDIAATTLYQFFAPLALVCLVAYSGWLGLVVRAEKRRGVAPKERGQLRASHQMPGPEGATRCCGPPLTTA